jgi:hypothetical protein
VRSIPDCSIMDSTQLRADLECVAGRKPLREDDDLPSVLKRLDTFRDASSIDSKLRHYLANRSYVKAIEWLDNPEMPHRP